jgi:RNA polymerase sigma-70 factor (ECF subfamily)
MKQSTMLVENAWLEYQKQLSTFIRSRVATNEDAEDILNDVFSKLVQQADRNNLPDSVAAWLYRVTRNAIVDYYRSRKQFEQLPEELSEEIDDGSAIGQLSKCMLPMIRALPETYQKPLLLSEIERQSNKEVADKLGLSLAAVKSRILRGRQKLHSSLVNCCTIYHNDAGKVVDFEQKSATNCGGCEE